MNFLLSFPHLKKIQALSHRRKLSVYLVGGFLRDQLLNRAGYDFDFAVSKDAISLARALGRAIKGAFVLLHEEHPCGRVVKKEKGVLWTFDFSNFRASTIEKDLGLRDFTINTLCLNLRDINHTTNWIQKLLDSPQAAKDLKLQTVRMVAPKAFVDDPLRLMRAFSLFAQLGFKIEAKTFGQIQKNVKLIHKVSIERVREEWFKILSSQRTFETLLLMQKSSLLEQVIPQVTVMKGVHQGGYHHLDVWRHSLEVVRQFEELVNEIKLESLGVIASPANGGTKQSFKRSPRPLQGLAMTHFIHDYLQEEIAGGHKRYALLKFACLLHDIGKPDTRKKEADRMTFHGHEHVGSRLVRIIAKQMKLSVKERHFLEDLTTWHLRPGYLSNFKKPSERMIFRFLRDTKEEALSVLLLSLADQRSTRGALTTKAKHQHHQKICWQMTERFIQQKNQKPLVRLMTGHDLIKKLKLKPSPLFTKILCGVQEAQSLGKISTKEEALILARKIARI
ncbi:MAG: HD domain-containing protein [Candidatus Omnitrophica bacterium]|nr:HD domain-containing protein [Candidatus Omnitrophota bacterium]